LKGGKEKQGNNEPRTNNKTIPVFFNAVILLNCDFIFGFFPAVYLSTQSCPED
jgi:hypothetical protein